jgi:hypothetical protein
MSRLLRARLRGQRRIRRELVRVQVQQKRATEALFQHLTKMMESAVLARNPNGLN